jgi:hypothetical protein
MENTGEALERRGAPQLLQNRHYTQNPISEVDECNRLISIIDRRTFGMP